MRGHTVARGCPASRLQQVVRPFAHSYGPARYMRTGSEPQCRAGDTATLSAFHQEGVVFELIAWAAHAAGAPAAGGLDGGQHAQQRAAGSSLAQPASSLNNAAATNTPVKFSAPAQRAGSWSFMPPGGGSEGGWVGRSASAPEGWPRDADALSLNPSCSARSDGCRRCCCMCLWELEAANRQSRQSQAGTGSEGAGPPHPSRGTSRCSSKGSPEPQSRTRRCRTRLRAGVPPAATAGQGPAAAGTGTGGTASAFSAGGDGECQGLETV